MPSTFNKTIKNCQQLTETFQHPTAVTNLGFFCKFTKPKFASLKERIDSVENKITEQYETVIGLIRNIDKIAKSALDLVVSNSALVAENTEKISSSHEFEYQTLLERLESLETENKKIKEELEDSENRNMRKTLLFRNIQQDHRKASLIKQE